MREKEITGEGRSDALQPSTEVRIIRLLRKDPSGGYTSGESLSRELGVSRTAVWKHIKSLRKAGFSIESSQSKGYRLAGDVRPFNGIEISAGLKTSVIGSKLLYYDGLSSTNTTAFELARNGAPEGTAVVADTQSGGKGRLGRRWVSPPGRNVYTSIVFRPKIPPQRAHNLTLLMAVATAEAVSRFCPGKISVKWPNDILVGPRKIAGILMEMSSEADAVNFVIAGVGVNVNVTEGALGPELRGRATSIRDTLGAEVDRVEFVQALYSAVEKWYKLYINKGFTPIVEAWRAYFPSEGKPVRVNVIDRVVEGICMGIDSSGALLVRTPAGVVETILSGDMEVPA